jgi:hypothetical protein
MIQLNVAKKQQALNSAEFRVLSSEFWKHPKDGENT